MKTPKRMEFHDDTAGAAPLVVQLFAWIVSWIPGPSEFSQEAGFWPLSGIGAWIGLTEPILSTGRMRSCGISGPFPS